MTTSQLDHLRAIDAHLTALLAMAAKRTPGEWHNHSDWPRVLCGSTQIVQVPQKLTLKNKGPSTPDAAFIAACAGRAEAGWLNSKDEIADLITFDENCRGWKDDNGCAGAAIQRIQHRVAKICERWPLELLTLP